MNCGDFRYLVQKRFDVELSPQDDRALLIHLETCDSCQKFYHQVQQVIIAAEELELSEELLPQRPDALLSKILETLPKDKLGLKEILLSFLNRFGLGQKSSEENQIPKESGLLPPRISQVSNRLKQTLSEADDFGSAQGVIAPQSQSVLNWGEPNLSSAKNLQQETPQEPYPVNTATQSDQVITRSLGEKFGMSGANSQLNNKQGLSLAESIKQKISEMSKSNIEYQSTSLGSEQMGEPMDEWTIPHSPQWPKLNTDAGPEQWPNENTGNRAPNAWGSPISNWGGQNQPETINSVAHFMPQSADPSEQYVSAQSDAGIFQQSQNQFQQAPEQFQQAPEQFEQTLSPSQDQMTEGSGAKANTWSPQAELMETGNWKMVQFDTTLGATGYSDSSPLSPISSINSPWTPPSQEPIAPPHSSQSGAQSSLYQHAPTEDQQFVQPLGSFPITNLNELQAETSLGQVSSAADPKQENKQQLDFPIENFPQLFMADTFLPPSTAPDKEPKPTSTPTPSAQDTTHPIHYESLPFDNASQQALTAQKKASGSNDSQTSSTGSPRIYSVMSKRAQMSAEASVSDASSNGVVPAQPPLASHEPTVNPISFPVLSTEPVKPSLLVSNAQLSASALPIVAPAEPPPSAKSELEDDPSRLFNFDDGAIDKLFSNNLGVHERAIPAQVPMPKSLPIASEQPVPSATEIAINLNTNTNAFNFALDQPPAPNNNVSGTFSEPNGSDNSVLDSQANLNQLLSASIQSVAASISGPAIAPIPDFKPDTSAPAISSPSAYSASLSSFPSSEIPPRQSVSDSSGLMAVDDSLIDRIFADTLGVPEHISNNVVGKSINERILPEVNPSVSEAVPAQSLNVVPDLATNLNPTFGQNPSSSYASGKQKIAGVGKLDSRGEVAGDPGSGRIASIGKFLLDNKDLEKIGKLTAIDLSESKMRTLTVEAYEELKNLLNQIDAQEGVTGTVIVGHDGLLIANTVPLEMDPESLGVWALGVFMGTAHVVEKLGDDNVRQIVSQTNQGYLIIANFGAGLLVTLTNPIMLDKLLPLMRTITQLVAA